MSVRARQRARNMQRPAGRRGHTSGASDDPVGKVYPAAHEAVGVRIRVRPVVANTGIWVGLCYHPERQLLEVFPVPRLGLQIEWRARHRLAPLGGLR